MVAATRCNFGSREISVEEAIKLHHQDRANNHKAPAFRCIECGRQVRPHQSGGHTSAHFEHLKRNKNCPLSHKKKSEINSVDPLSVVIHGGGFADPETRRAVELAAISYVIQVLDTNGFVVEDCQSANLGYDLLARKDRKDFYYEVKGTDSVAPRFFITRNERKYSVHNKNWRLAVVTSARSNPTLEVFTANELNKRFTFDPLAWECNPLSKMSSHDIPS